MVFFWGLDCFNCEIAKKAMLAQPEAIRALGLKWFHSNVYEHRELGRRFMLHGVPTWFFFHRGKRLGRATGWHGLGQFEAAVAAAREKVLAKLAGSGTTGRSGHGRRQQSRSGRRLKKIKDRIAFKVLKTMRTHLC